MNGLKKFFTFIFKQGNKNSLNEEVIWYMRANIGSFDLVEDTVAHYSNRIYKKNGKYRRGGQALHQHIIEVNNTINPFNNGEAEGCRVVYGDVITID
jgi:hypothetical protein